MQRTRDMTALPHNGGEKRPRAGQKEREEYFLAKVKCMIPGQRDGEEAKSQAAFNRS